MKFGKYIEHELVPEWKDVYVSYKKGKKIITNLQSNPHFVNDIKQGLRLSAPHQVDDELYQLHPAFSDFLRNQIAKVESFYESLIRDAEERRELIIDQADVYSKLDLMRKHGDFQKSENVVLLRRVEPPWKRLLRRLTQRVHLQKLPRFATRQTDIPSDAYSPRMSQKKLHQKLKSALSDYYDFLSLVSQYQTLNLTAFRKILKKYDKTFDTFLQEPIMRKNVDQQAFADNSHVESLQRATTALYARLFTHNDLKKAADRLRSVRLQRSYSSISMRAGILLGAGVVLSIEGLCYYQSNEREAYLLQIWGGFFLLIFGFLCFCVNCFIWQTKRINYVLIFEFNMRKTLDWHEYLELVSVLFFLFSLFFWLSLRNFFPGFTIYFPVLFLGIVFILSLLPIRRFFGSTRLFCYRSLFRILLSGLFSVCFVDFFFADQLVSLAYASGNIALFFCLYAKKWNDPASCNSSHSPLMGFFTTLPYIFRFLQCIRRFADTAQSFPHLANMLKYTFGMLSQVFLSLWRRFSSRRYYITYLVFAALNAIYSYIWDVVMDWSLIQRKNRKWGFRPNRVYGGLIIYIIAMIFNAIIRCAFIFYGIFPGHIQHSSNVSFFMCFAEVIRRSVWNLFRLENEEIYNRENFRAARDTQLPDLIRPKVHDQRDKTISGAHAQDFERHSVVYSDDGTEMTERTDDD